MNEGCHRDHCAVFGTQLERWKVQGKAVLQRQFSKSRPQLNIGADAAGDHQCLQSALSQRGERFCAKNLDHSLDESARDVGARLFA